MLLLLVRLGWKWPWRGEPRALGSGEGAFQEQAVQGVTKHTRSQWSSGQPRWVTPGQRRAGTLCLLSSPCLPLLRASSSAASRQRAFSLRGRIV